MRVAVIDPDALNRLELARALRANGHEVETFDCCEECALRIANGDFDMHLVDLDHCAQCEEEGLPEDTVAMSVSDKRLAGRPGVKKDGSFVYFKDRILQMMNGLDDTKGAA